MTQQASGSQSAPISASQASKPAVVNEPKAAEKGYKFNCKICGIPWEHKVKNTLGMCVTCVGLRRHNQSYLNSGVIKTKKELLDRLSKIFA